MKGPTMQLNGGHKQTNKKHMVVIRMQMLGRIEFKCVPKSGLHHTMEKMPFYFITISNTF